MENNKVRTVLGTQEVSRLAVPALRRLAVLRVVSRNGLFPFPLKTLVHFAKGCWDFNFLLTNGFSIEPVKVELLAGKQKATEKNKQHRPPNYYFLDHLQNAPPPLLASSLGMAWRICFQPLAHWLYPIPLTAGNSPVSACRSAATQQRLQGTWLQQTAFKPRF